MYVFKNVYRAFFFSFFLFKIVLFSGIRTDYHVNTNMPALRKNLADFQKHLAQMFASRALRKARRRCVILQYTNGVYKGLIIDLKGILKL